MVKNKNLIKNSGHKFKQVNTRYKMNEIVNKFLLAQYKFIPEMHLGQWRFIYKSCGPFTKNKEQIKKFKEQKIHDMFIKTN